jgi:redox-sensitive bicupin YhaK (pirin superfamily)
MANVQAKSPMPSLARAIVRRTRGRTHGPTTRLMSPSGFGEILKPFVFLDLFDHEGAPFNSGLHPHSGIATLTYLMEGAVTYIDPDNIRGILPAGGVEWMQAGRGMWHGGGLDKSGRTRGFQLWIALPPELELGPVLSIYQAPEDVPQDGPARVLLGSYGAASSAIASPSPINYLAVRLKAGERWRYQPPAGHTVLWAAIASGALSAPDDLGYGSLAAFEPSSEAVEFVALNRGFHFRQLIFPFVQGHVHRTGATPITLFRLGPSRIDGGQTRLVTVHFSSRYFAAGTRGTLLVLLPSVFHQDFSDAPLPLTLRGPGGKSIYDCNDRTRPCIICFTTAISGDRPGTSDNFAPRSGSAWPGVMLNSA